MEDFTARVLIWCQRMRHEGDDDIANLLASAEMTKRKKPRVPRAKRVTLARNGKRVRGGQAFVNLDNPDVQVEELK